MTKIEFENIVKQRLEKLFGSKLSNEWYLKDAFIRIKIEELIKEVGEELKIPITQDNRILFAYVGLTIDNFIDSFWYYAKPYLNFQKRSKHPRIVFTEQQVFNLTKEAIGLYREINDANLVRRKKYHGKWFEKKKQEILQQKLK